MVEVKRIDKVDEEILSTITTWIYNWEGMEKGYSFDEIKDSMRSGLSDEYPHTYGIFLNGLIIGMCQISYGILKIGNDFYPWIINLYIDEVYRNKGYGRMLFEGVKEILTETTDFKIAILHTEHKGLFEKFGCDFICDLDMTLGNKTTKESVYRVVLR